MKTGVKYPVDCAGAGAGGVEEETLPEQGTATLVSAQQRTAAVDESFIQVLLLPFGTFVVLEPIVAT